MIQHFQKHKKQFVAILGTLVIAVSLLPGLGAMWVSAEGEAPPGNGHATEDNSQAPAPSAQTTENPPVDAGTGFVSDFLSTWVNDKLIGIGKGLFYIGGVIFDTFIGASLSSDFIRNDSFVSFGWVIVRDIANTAFIFVLLYIAIMTILQAGGTGMKELVVSLIIAALFVNFSLYITRFVIDISNVVATEFYNKVGFAPDTVPSQMLIQGKPVRSISAAFSGRAAAMDLGMKDEISKDTDSSRRALRTVALGLSACILYFVGFFILLSAGFLFFARAIALWFVMIFAPLAFVAVIIPGGAKKIWGKWSSTLVSQALMAPIFLFFLYLIFAFMNPEVFSGQKNLITYSGKLDLTAGNGGIASVLINDELPYIILMGMLVAALGIAREMAGKIGATTEKYGKLGVGGVVAGAAAGAALVGRNSIGWAGQKVQETDYYKRMKARGGIVGKTFTGATDKIATSSFDVRAAGIKGLTVGAGMKTAGLGSATPGGKGGRVVTVEERRSAQKKDFEALKDPDKQAKMLSRMSNQDARLLFQSLPFNKQQEIIKHASPEQRSAWSAITGGIGGTLGAAVGLDTAPWAASRRKSERAYLTGLAGEKKAKEDARQAKLKKAFEETVEQPGGTAGPEIKRETTDKEKAAMLDKMTDYEKSLLMKAYNPNEAENFARSIEANVDKKHADLIRQLSAGVPTVSPSATPDEKTEAYQKAYRSISATIDKESGRVLRTAAENKARFLEATTDAKELGILWNDSSDSLRAEIISVADQKAGAGGPEDTKLKDKLVAQTNALPQSEQVKTHQAVLRKMRDRVNMETGDVIETAEQQKAKYYAGIQNEGVRNETIANESPEVLADIQYQARSKPEGASHLPVIEKSINTLPAATRERVRTAEIGVRRREETRNNKKVIFDSINSVKDAPPGTPLSEEHKNNIKNALAQLKPQQVAELETSLLTSGHLDDYMDIERLKEIDKRGELSEPEIKALLENYVQKQSTLATSGDEAQRRIAREELIHLKKNNKSLLRILDEGARNMVLALADEKKPVVDKKQGEKNI